MPPKRGNAKKNIRSKRDVQSILPSIRPKLDHSSSDICGTCLLAVSDDAQVGLIDCCRHTFHHDCISRWSETENTCPQCKLRFSWLACYSFNDERSSLQRIKKRDQEFSEDEDCDDDITCEVCKQVGDESSLLLCDGMHGTCNTAFHYACVGLQDVPVGSWFCKDCVDKGLDIDASGYSNTSGWSEETEASLVGTRKRRGQDEEMILECDSFPVKFARSLDSSTRFSWRCMTCTLENDPCDLSCIACGFPKPDELTSSNHPCESLLGALWNCSMCTLANHGHAQFCVACGTQRNPMSTSRVDELDCSANMLAKVWICSACTLENDFSNLSCSVCGKQRPPDSSSHTDDSKSESPLIPGNECTNASYLSQPISKSSPSTQSCLACTFVNDSRDESCAVCGTILASAIQRNDPQPREIVVEIED